MTEDQIIGLLTSNIIFLLAAAFVVVIILKGIKIVPQSEKYVVERFGRLHAVLGPGINFIVPFLDVARHKISILERQLPNATQDAITKDNVLVQIDTSVFYRILEPEKTVYRIRDVDGAIATTVAGIVRAEIGKMDLDEVQSNRAQLIERIQESVETAVDDWGIEVTKKSRAARRMLKFAFNMIDDGLVGQQLFAGEATRLGYMTDEAQEGRDAFLEKRDPDFSRFPWRY